jgi:hypothetical protein
LRIIRTQFLFSQLFKKILSNFRSAYTFDLPDIFPEQDTQKGRV